MTTGHEERIPLEADQQVKFLHSVWLLFHRGYTKFILNYFFSLDSPFSCSLMRLRNGSKLLEEAKKFAVELRTSQKIEAHFWSRGNPKILIPRISNSLRASNFIFVLLRWRQQSRSRQVASASATHTHIHIHINIHIHSGGQANGRRIAR